jgi:hypothetical protein
MLEDLNAILKIQPFGTTVSVGELALVALLILVGYLASR